MSSSPAFARPGGEHGRRPKPALSGMDFGRSPFLVIWEMTQACDLACRHCRADAQPDRNDGELTTVEAKRLMDRMKDFGNPLFILTGGDPLKRPDTVELVEYGNSIGLRMAMTPSGTPLMTPEVLASLADAGLSRLAVSLDGSTADIHDRFRGVSGSWEWTVRMIRAARELGLSTQVNTSVGRHNVDDFEQLIARMEELGISLWSVFFLVPTGRASKDDLAGPEEFEALFQRMYTLSRTASFDIKSTAAPHYRRVILQRQVEERNSGTREAAPTPLTPGIGFSLRDGVGRAKGVNDGDGLLFISHTGEIYPSGFLPVSAGNIRSHDPVEVYRTNPIFTALRDRSQLKGKCGVCEYVDVCGGSRARAFAMTGDYLEAEPFCTHIPRRYQKMVDAGIAEPVDEYFDTRIPAFGARPAAAVRALKEQLMREWQAGIGPT